MATGLGDLVQAEWEDAVEAIEKCYELGWTEGLPVVPPTADRVRQFIERSGLPPDHVVGSIPERRREVTVEKIAANAVMAGCLPDYVPVLMAATEALLDPAFNLIGPSSSLGGAGFLVIVNGPITHELGINSRNNLFGPGNRANSTIGRFVRLLLMNACASIPGLFDRSIHGHPGKFSFCIGENETETHWDPLHVERGFSRQDSAVTVFAALGPRQTRMDPGAERILTGVADAASSLGTFMSTPLKGAPSKGQCEMALVIGGTSDIWDGWSKKDVREFLSVRIGKSAAELKRAGIMEGDIEPGDTERFVPFGPLPEDILLVFAGGSEMSMCSLIPCWSLKPGSIAVTKAIKT